MVRATSLILSATLSHCISSAAITPGAPKFDNTKRDTIPDYAITYAPYSYLYSGESWWPSDVTTHLEHCTPKVGFVAIGPAATLETLHELAPDVYLTSDDNVEDNPTWLLGIKPDSSGYTSAPATIIVVDKTEYVDVFYFYFYSYNHGLTVLGSEYGNHVGDWEHTMIRFVNGVPQYIYLSEHSGGKSYTFDAIPLTDRTDGRPTTYIATGSHANYVTTGKQDYEGTLLGLIGLYDTTDAGVFWDITKNYRGFTYDINTSTFAAASSVNVGVTEERVEGADWLLWLGSWGDKQYPTSDSRQNCFLEDVAGECRYNDGLPGPFGKNLERIAVCEHESDCIINTSLQVIEESSRNEVKH